MKTDIVRAENCDLYDSEGRRYVDLESGVWCTSIGHGHPRILRVLAEQSARISHAGFNYSTAVAEAAAGEILALLGFDGGRCVFLSSGSDAIEYGVRVAQMVTPHPLFLTMVDSYFGAYGSASRRNKEEWLDFDWSPCADCVDSRDCDAGCERWGSIPWMKIGGFLFEPGSSSGLVRFPPRKLIERIVRTVRAAGGLVLINEVTTGVGRTGRWFGFQHYEIAPDVVAMGKGIGNGYPVSVTTFAPGVICRLGERPVRFAQSHQNDPLGAAVAREVIRVIREEGLVERGREIAAALLAGLQEIQSRTDRIREIRSRGLMLAIEIEDDPDASLTIHLHHELVRRGFVVARRPGLNVLRIDPALTVERGDIERFLKTFEAVVLGRDG